MQRRALNFERREPAISRRDFRAHGRERIENPAHRPAPQRTIARDHRREGLPCEDTGEKSHRGAGIAGVERPSRRFQAAQTLAGYANRAISVSYTHLDVYKRQGHVEKEKDA